MERAGKKWPWCAQVLTVFGHGRSSSLQLRYHASYWRQLAVLSRRLGKATWVDPMLLAMNWGAALLMALGLGIVYWHATRDTGQHLASLCYLCASCSCILLLVPVLVLVLVLGRLHPHSTRL